MLEKNRVVERIAKRIWDGLVELEMIGPETAEELQGKFQSVGAGMLSYAGLETFFGGLEGLVGAPLPRVRDAIAAEHCERPDSREFFTTTNYSVRTTSEIEWRFVVEPKNEPENGWPTEAKLLIATTSTVDLSKKKKRGGWGRIAQADSGDASPLPSPGCGRESSPMSGESPAGKRNDIPKLDERALGDLYN